MSKSANEMVNYLCDHMKAQEIAALVGLTPRRIEQVRDSTEATINSTAYLNLIALYQRTEMKQRRLAKKAAQQ